MRDLESDPQQGIEGEELDCGMQVWCRSLEQTHF